MNIEGKIRQIAEDKFEGFSYVFEDWKTASVVADKVDLPAIICVMPVSGRLVFKNGRVRDSESIAIAFVDKVDRDANGEDNERIYSEMKKVAAQFVNELMRCGFFEPLDGEVLYNVIYEDMSVNVTGVFVDIPLREIIGECI